MPLTPITDIFAGRRTVGDRVLFTVTEDWSQGRALYGGLVGAVLLRGLRDLLGIERPLRSAQVVFAGPVPVGDVAVTARLLRSGKSATLAQAEIVGDGDVPALVTAAFGEARESAIHLTPPLVTVPSGPEALEPMPYLAGLVPAFLQHVDARWLHGTLPYSGSKDSRTRIFLNWRDALPDPETALIAYSDAIPSPVLSMLDRFAQASSLTWSLELPGDTLTMPMDGWFRMDAHLDSVAGGYALHHAALYDSAGHLRSVSRQVVSVFG